MDIGILLAKIVGAILFIWTLWSIVKHVKARRAMPEQEQSLGEQFLNNIFLYLWLAFMTVFSLGMIVNN